MYLCAKRLVPFIRDNIDYLALKFGYTEQLKTKLARISSTTVGRMLAGNPQALNPRYLNDTAGKESQ
nr:hypothetical protein [Treponema socranskii]